MAIIISLRKVIKGTAGRIFMGFLFLAMFGGLGLSRVLLKYLGGGSIEGIAEVNGVEVSRQLFQKTVAQEDRKLSHIRQQYGKNADLYMRMAGINSDPQINALNTLIHAEIMEQFAQGLSVHIAHGYLEARLADPRFLLEEAGELLPQEVFTKQGSLDTFAALEYLKGTGQMPVLEKVMKEKLTKQFAILMLQSGFFVPSYDIRQIYIERKLAKKFSYQTFSFDVFFATEKTKGATDEKLKAFYNEQNKLSRRYWTSEKRDASIWTFVPTEYGITVEESEMDAFYQKNRSTRFIKDPVQIQVREIVLNDVENKGLKALAQQATEIHTQLAQDPTQFEKLAKEHSMNKKTASQGGLGEFFKRGTHEKEYEKAAFKLKQDGEVSPVVPVEKGFVIVQRVARKDASFQSFENVKEDIRKILLEQKFKTEFTKLASQLSRQEKPHEARDAFTASHNGTKTTMRQVKRETEDQLEQRLFALRNEGDFTTFISNGKGIILQLDGKTKSEQAPFDTVKAAVANDFYEDQATKALEAAVKQAKATVLKTGSLAPVDGGKISSTVFIKMDDEKEIKALADAGFPQESMELDWKGAVLATFSPKNGIVVRLDDIEEAQEDDFTEKRPELLRAIFERSNSVFTHAFIASLFRTATIKVDDSISRVKDLV